MTRLTKSEKQKIMEQLADDIENQFREPLKNANRMIEEAGLKGNVFVAASSNFERLKGENYEMGALQIVSHVSNYLAPATLLEIALMAVDKDTRDEDGYFPTASVVALDVAGALELLDKLHYDITAHLKHHYDVDSIKAMVDLRKGAMGILEALDGK